MIMEKLNLGSMKLGFAVILLAIANNVLAIDRAELLKQHQQAQLTLAWCDAHIAVIEGKFKTGKLDEHNSEHVLYRDNTLKFVAEKRAEFALLASRVVALDQDRASDVIVK